MTAEKPWVFLFDLDGVLTPTVDLHIRAWQETFDEVFAAHNSEPFTMSDYHNCLDGRARFDGVHTLLHARGIELPWGSEDDRGIETVCGIGNEKNRHFQEVLARDGIAPYPGSAQLLQKAKAAGIAMAVVSSSRNAPAVIAAANLAEFFQTVVDGNVAAALQLPGKPHPDTFVHAATLLGSTPESAVVFEDAVSGVQAGAAGNFAHVVGVDRGAGTAALKAAGAHTVVTDLDAFDTLDQLTRNLTGTRQW